MAVKQDLKKTKGALKAQRALNSFLNELRATGVAVAGIAGRSRVPVVAGAGVAGRTSVAVASVAITHVHIV
jgi:hypothetical protein